MAENKNQSIAGWPSVTGSRTSGLDLRGLNPQLQRNAKVLEAYQKRYASDVSAVKQMGDATARLTKITQDINAKNFARQDQLLTARQGNFQRMNEMYGNYFQQFGNVLNESALKFLDEHSNIGVPTLTAIMAGYEHVKASRAQQELAMLDRQAKMAEAAYALDKQRADLEALKDQNAALSQQIALENQIKAIDAINKSQNQYYSDVARVYGAGVAGGRGTGVAGVGGLGSGSAAGSFQAPVTGGGGTGAVAGGGATGFVDPSNPQVAALNKMIDNSKAAQTAGQGVQYGPITQQMADVDKQVTDWSDLSGTPLFAGAVGATGAAWALNKYGNRAQVGYIKPSELARYNQAKGLVGQVNTALNASGYDAARIQVQADMAGSKLYNKVGGDLDKYIKEIERRDSLRTRLANKGLTGTLTAREQRVLTSLMPNAYELDSLKNIQDMKNIKSNYYDPLTTQKKILENQLKTATTDNIKAYNKANNFARFRGSVARGAGKLAGYATKGLWAASMIDLANSFADEGVGIVAGATTWAKNTLQDLSGITRQRLAEDPDYLRNRPTPTQVGQAASRYVLAAKNNFFNMGGVNTDLGNDIANMTVDRLRTLGYDPTNIEISQIIEKSKRDPQDSANALEALLRAQGDGSGNLAGTNDSIIKFYNDVLAESAYQRTYATQVKKAAQNQQVTDQEIMRDQRIADALARKPKFFAGMAEYLTRVGREAGYDFDEADAAAMMGRLIEMNQIMESGGKFGAEGADTSTGRAKSRHQFMDMTFDQLRKWMLEDDNKAGGIFFDDNERNALRQARTANDLDNEQFGYLLDLMVPYYLMKDNVNIGKFGKGNPNIGSLQALVDLSQMTKDIGISPYLDSSMNALRMAGFGRFKAGKEFDETVSRFNRDWQGPIWSAQFGDRATSNGAYRSRDMYLQDFANNGILLGPYQNKIPANEYLQWVNEYFVVDKDGNITGIKEGANPKHLDKWREENGLTRVQKVATQTPITMSQYIKKLDNDVDFDNLNWHTRNQLNKAAEELGKYNLSIQLNSGYRSQEYQDKLRKRFESGDTKGIRYKPAKYSPHTRGDSIDIQDTLLEQDIKGNEELRNKYKDAAGFMKAFGFNRTVKGDDVHFELDKSFANQKAENQPMSLPSLPALRQAQPFSPAQWTDPVVESANQGIVDPLDLSAFDGMMPGGVNFSPTNYGVAMEQMQQQYPQEGYIDESMIVW